MQTLVLMFVSKHAFLPSAFTDRTLYIPNQPINYIAVMLFIDEKTRLKKLGLCWKKNCNKMGAVTSNSLN
jgi:hypothetical protein